MYYFGSLAFRFFKKCTGDVCLDIGVGQAAARSTFNLIREALVEAYVVEQEAVRYPPKTVLEADEAGFGE